MGGGTNVGRTNVGRGGGLTSAKIGGLTSAGGTNVGIYTIIVGGTNVDRGD